MAQEAVGSEEVGSGQWAVGGDGAMAEASYVGAYRLMGGGGWRGWGGKWLAQAPGPA